MLFHENLDDILYLYLMFQRFKLFFITSFFVASNLLAQNSIPKVQYGSINRIENIGGFVDGRNVDIWLPPNYRPSEKYPVLYMHDGQMLFDSAITWNKQEWNVDGVLSKLILNKEIKPLIVVGIWNNGSKRRAEYLPEDPIEILSDGERQFLLGKDRLGILPLFENPVQSNNYLKFIVETLKPKIDSMFLTHKSENYIGGSSMGGLISLYAICKYPEVFKGAVCMSTHWPGLFINPDSINPFYRDFQKYLDLNLPDPKTHKIYFDHGNKTLDSMYGPAQNSVNQIMADLGYAVENKIDLKKIKFKKGTSCLSLFFEGKDHSELSWSERLHIPMKYLFGY